MIDCPTTLALIISHLLQLSLLLFLTIIKTIITMKVAQSTFFMEQELGRARVFQQWGDDEETIQIAIETCPVDCIHYVPYDELKKLEIERRDQNINFKSRLVNSGDYGGGGGAGSYGGSSAYTAPQKISGNMKPRCNNCPSRGCKNCPSKFHKMIASFKIMIR
jgi:hypothetical protein